MSSFLTSAKKHLLTMIIFWLGGLSVQAANEEDIGSLTFFPRSYENLKEKSYYHQTRVIGMKRDMNDYGGRVHDLRSRFDRIFKDRETNLAPPTPFEIGEAVTWEDPRERTGITYQGPNSPHRLRRTSPRVRVRNPIVDSTQYLEKPAQSPPSEISDGDGSPLAFVVEGPKQVPLEEEEQEEEQEAPPSRRKFEYYVLPRLGMSFPTTSDYDSGLAFTANGGIVRDDWRFGLNFSYSSNDISSNVSLGGIPTPLTGDTQSYSLLAGVSREMPLVDNWTGSIGLGFGGGWSTSDKTLSLPAGPYPLHSKEGGFVWQLGLGARRPFGETASVYLGYRYLGHPTVSSHNLEAGAEVGF